MRQESNVVSRISWCGDVGTSLRTAGMGLIWFLMGFLKRVILSRRSVLVCA